MPLITYLNEVFAEKKKIKFSHANSLIVCGAGISKDSHLPLGGEIIDRIFKDFDLGELTEFFEQFNKEIISDFFKIDTPFFNQARLEVIFNGIKQVSSPEEFKDYVFEVLFSKLGKPDPALGTTTCEIAPNFNHYLLAQFIRNGGTCITFNFDELIETAYEGLYGEPLHQVSFPLDSNHVHAGPCIIKAHGTLDSKTNSMKDIGIDTDNLFIDGFSPNDTAFLEKALTGIENIVCIGYSVSDTLDFLPFLRNHYTDAPLNFYLFKYQLHLELDCARFVDLEKGQTGYFQIDHFLTGVIQDFAFIYYDPYNPVKGLATYAVLPKKKVTVAYTFNHGLLEKFKTDKKEIVKLKIIETLSLPNRFGENEMESLQQKDPKQYALFNFDKENRTGKYGKNALYILKTFVCHPSIENYNKVFGILNEFVFLTRGLKYPFMRSIVAVALILPMWISLLLLRLSLSREKEQYLVVNRNLYMPSFRLSVFTGANNFITKLITKHTLNQQRKSSKIAIEQKNLRLFRYIQKDKIKIEYALEKDREKAIRDIDALIIKNIDTNHYIDVTNLARLKHEITQDARDKELLLRLTLLTNDKLNQSKI